MMPKRYALPRGGAERRMKTPKTSRPASLAAAHGSVLRCRCWDVIGEICDVAATHLVGPSGGKRGIPMPCCTRHAKHYMTVKGVTVIALNAALSGAGEDSRKPETL